MKIIEIINEADSSRLRISKRHQQSTRGLNTFSDGERWDGDYTAYRLGLAVAGTDGKIKPDIKPKSWVGKSKSAHPYTKEEQEMLNRGYEAVGADHQDLNKGDLKSRELDTVNRTSPVAAKKRNKYGV